MIDQELATPSTEHAGGHDGGGGGAREADALLVDQEDPVGIAVEGQPDVGAVLADRRLEVA